MRKISKKGGFFEDEKNGDFRAQTNVTIRNGAATSERFSNRCDALQGSHTLTISMLSPGRQSEAVRAIIGARGERLAGSLV